MDAAKEATKALEEKILMETIPKRLRTRPEIDKAATAKAKDGIAGDRGIRSAGDIIGIVRHDVETISDLVSRSNNLNGTLKRVLKNAAANVLGLAEELAGLTVSEEASRLREQNSNLRA